MNTKEFLDRLNELTDEADVNGSARIATIACHIIYDLVELVERGQVHTLITVGKLIEVLRDHDDRKRYE